MFGLPVPMPVLAVLEACTVTVLYALIFVAAPSWALSRRLEGMRLCERFLIYIVFGNFCVINIVLLLELLHISHTVTVAAAYAGLLLFLRWKLYGDSPLRFAQEVRVTILKLAHRTLTWRQVWLKRSFRPLAWLKKKLMGLVHDLPTVLLLVVCMAVVIYIFGTNTITNYGYSASDSVVHNYWINGLIDNKLFVGGIYPMGYHCEVYAIHVLSGIPVYVILRVLGFVQTFFIMLTMLAFLRAVCRSWFAPFASLIPFFVATGANYDRYIYGVPQENGIIFILPTLWFAFKFFEQLEIERKGELDATLPKMKFLQAPSTRWLVGFAMGVSLTIAVHFYDFFALAFFIVAGALCFALRLVRPRFLWRVFAAGTAGLLVAILPMALAFALGTPLHGSFGWGFNQMGITTSSQSQGGGTASSSASASSASAASSAAPTSGDTSAVSGTSGSSSGAQNAPAPKKPLTERLVKLYSDTVEVCSARIAESWDRVGARFGSSFGWCYWCVAVVIVACGVALRFFGQRDYAARVATMGLALVVMGVELASTGLPWPTLMDVSRMESFMNCLVPICLAVGVDGFVVLATLWAKHRMVCHVASGAALALAFCVAYSLFGMQNPVISSSFEPNGNILCVERILREYSNFNWTIVSANDELRMIEKYGYHSEINEFLNDMEHRLEWQGTTGNFSYRILPAKGEAIIPTEYVFFFIEKIPTAMNLFIESGTAESGFVEEVPHGTPISEEWANNILPGLPTIISYRGENRLVEMSRMYFWAQEYLKRFPNEMKVFYEDDEMVCYRLHQPKADWTDLYIEYGYNDVTARKMLAELTNGDTKLYGMTADGQMHSYSFVSASTAGLGYYVAEGGVPSNAVANEEGMVGRPNQSASSAGEVSVNE